MSTLPKLIPDADTLLSLAPEELAFYVLRAARHSMQNNLCSLQYILGPLSQSGQHYYGQRYGDVEVAVTEAWMWLENQLFLVPAQGMNGAHGFRILGRRARDIQTDTQFAAFRKAGQFPKELLHPLIAERAWIALMRNEFDSAVFFSFRAVEEAVRDAGRYDSTKLGVNLMREAFHPETGPLTDVNQPKAEREALQALFAGAIGSYKNPHSHRSVRIEDAAEAQEMVMLASHLLRIVDARRPRP